MASQLVNSLKFGVLAAIAFFGPKVITETGDYLGRVETREENSVATGEGISNRLIHPSERGQKPAVPAKSSDSETPHSAFRPVLSEKTIDEPFGHPPADSTSPLSVSDSPPISPPFTPLETIVRFDQTPATIIARWPKVWADDSAPPLRGYRVMVSTGSERDDLAGALTYSFDTRTLRRIHFTGQTGDFRKLLAFFEFRYGMVLKGESTAGEYRYEATLRSAPLTAEPVGELIVKPAAVFDSAHPDGNFDVTFDLRRPE